MVFASIFDNKFQPNSWKRRKIIFIIELNARL